MTTEIKHNISAALERLVCWKEEAQFVFNFSTVELIQKQNKLEQVPKEARIPQPAPLFNVSK